MTKTLELAVAKAAELSEPAQEQLGRELLERIETLARLRTQIETGISELDRGAGRPLDIEAVIGEVRQENAGG
jgi:transposase